MRIYTISNADRTGYLSAVDDGVNEIIFTKRMQGQEPDTKFWESITLEWRDGAGNISDLDIMPLMTGGREFTFSDRVKAVISTNNVTTGDWIRITVNSFNFWILFSNLITDALDEDQSKIRKLKSGKVLSIDQYVFNENKIPNENIFKIKTKPQALLCTDFFVDFVKNKKWNGFWFKPVWDSKVEPFSAHPNRDEIITRPDVFGPDGFVKGYEDFWPDEWKHNEAGK